VVKLLEIKQKWERVPAPDMHAAVADFEAHLIAVLRRQKFTICPPRNANEFRDASTLMPPAPSLTKSRQPGR
jgi:hypothetical protein